jgi:transposase
MDTEKRETAFAEQFLELLDANLKPKVAFEKIKKMGYTKTRSTMYRHIASVRRTGHALSLVKKDGSHSLFNCHQMSIVNSWISDQNTNNRPIGYYDVQKFIYDTFSIEVCKMTAGNVLHRLGHTLKTCQSKTSGFKKTNAALKEEYMAFITKMKNENRFFCHSSEIRSIDVTYTKKPPAAITTFSPKGGCKQRADSKTNLYTNAIVTMVSGDGHNHTPCLLFTHDPKMAKEQKKTGRGKRVRSEFEEALKEYNISEDRIIYVKSEKNYFAESPDVYEQFLKHYEMKKKIPQTALILHDGGKAFKRRKTSIFDNLGFTNHVTYPTDVHQFLSPNDNKLHGCKSTWYGKYYKFKNEVSSALCLMNLIDLDTLNNSKTYFKNNLFNVKKSDLDNIIGV